VHVLDACVLVECRAKPAFAKKIRLTAYRNLKDKKLMISNAYELINIAFEVLTVAVESLLIVPDFLHHSSIMWSGS